MKKSYDWVLTPHSKNESTVIISSYKAPDSQEAFDKLGPIPLGFFLEAYVPYSFQELENAPSSGTRAFTIYLNLPWYVFVFSFATLELCTCQQAFLGNEIFTKSAYWLLYYKAYMV